MENKSLRKAVARTMVLAMVVTTIFVPGVFDSAKVYGAEKSAKYNAVPSVTFPGKMVANKAFTVTVRGDNVATTTGAVDGAIAYIPTKIQFKRNAITEKTFNLSGSVSQAITNIKLSRVGNYTVIFSYKTKKLSGGVWADYGTTTNTKSINVWGTIKFNKNKGKFKKGSIKSKVVSNGKKYGTLAKLKKRSGYKFMGWYTAKTGGTKITKASKVNLSSDTTMYAQWKYKIKFNANKGTVKKKSKKVTSGKKYGTLPTPKRSGYDFLGWYTKKSGGTEITSTAYVAKASKHTLYAQWIKKGSDKYPGYFTKVKYQKVKVGMTYTEVSKIVGGSYDFMMSVTINGMLWHRISYWNVANKSSNASDQVIIIFTPGYVVKSKSNPFGW